MPAAAHLVLRSGPRRLLCRKERPSSAHARTRAKASPPALRQGNLFARRCITSAKVNTVRHLQNRQLPSDSRRPGARESSSPRRAAVRFPQAPARKPKETTAQVKAIPGANRRPSDPGRHRMPSRRRAILPLRVHLSPNKPEPPLAIAERLRDGTLPEKQAEHASTQEPRTCS